MPTPIKYHPDIPRSPHPPLSTATTLGILRTTLVPALPLHGLLSLCAYTAGRYTNRIDSKDLLWPSAFVVNAWYHGIISPYLRSNLTFVECITTLGYTQKLLLGGVTLWGTRLFGHIFQRVKKRDRDDSRYLVEKRDENYWNKALLGLYLPEAIFQSIISLGWSVALKYGTSRATGVAMGGSVGTVLGKYSVWIHGLAVGLYTAGFALEVLADSQLEQGKKKQKGLVTEGVWSIVRHPNYLGDALIHISFPLLAFAGSVFDPLMLLGPLANYLFLRFIGGDGQNEASQEDRYEKEDPLKYQQLQEYKEQKNCFWPALKEFGNTWTLAIIGLGATAAVAENLLKTYVLFTSGGIIA